MAAWIRIFCKRSIADQIPTAIQECVDDVDWHTLAEAYGIEDEKVVDSALKKFRIEQLKRSGDHYYRIYYRPKKLRQIDIDCWTQPEAVAEDLSDAKEALRGLPRARATKIRDHLAKVVEVTAIELGWEQLEGMAMVLASEIARWLAHLGGGWIKDHDDKWWTLTRRGMYKEL